tara:strand:+ start:80 stop:790 length:711 start_codon:yes stop_codon:yes gene_type:complete
MIHIKLNLSPNFTKKKRQIKEIKFVIIHYTGMQSEIESIKRLKNPKSRVSCHYLINREGRITQMVKDTNIAWHAGKSRWKKYLNLNKNSLGIELVNKGHQFGYQSFSRKQIASLVYLCTSLKKKYFIKKENFLGHSDISPLRKNDPGEKFPWKKLNSYNFGKWYKASKIKNLKKTDQMKVLFFKNLRKLGYRYLSVYNKNSKNIKIIKSFQQHYLPDNVTGKIDEKTYKISHFLTN